LRPANGFQFEFGKNNNTFLEFTSCWLLLVTINYSNVCATYAVSMILGALFHLILTKRPRSDRSLISKVKRRLGTSVILAIQEAEIRGIVAQSQPWANS
jgi:hypothetical protein